MTAAGAAFASNIEDIIWNWQPELWVRGSIRPVDHWIGGARVVCNSRGYETPT